MGSVTLVGAVEAAKAELGLTASSVTGVDDNVPRPALYAQATKRGDTASLAPTTTIVDMSTAVSYVHGPEPIRPPVPVYLRTVRSALLTYKDGLSRTYMYWFLLGPFPFVLLPHNQY